jgi:hypothetical protein
MNRYSVGAEFFVNAETEQDALTLVSNFIDSFPDQVGPDEDGDVILQDASVDEYDVEVEPASSPGQETRL